MSPTPPDGRAEARRRYRRFLLAHHPDRGGDREEFERGLAFHRAALAGAGGVVAHRSPGARRALRRWWHRRQRSRPGIWSSRMTRRKGERG